MGLSCITFFASLLANQSGSLSPPRHPGMTPSSLTIAAVQCPLRPDALSPLSSAKHAAVMMRNAVSSHGNDIDLFVLPELSPLGYSEHSFSTYIDSGDDHGAIDDLFRNLSRELKTFICYGTIGQTREENRAQHTIRQIVLNDKGEQIAMYDKIHLCNYGDCAETRFFTPGTSPTSFHCRGFEVGIIICADMRNAALSRHLAKVRSCDIIVQPAAFSRDLSFKTWKSFRETRAVENGVYFLGVNYAGDDFGESSFLEPWVDEKRTGMVLGREEGVLVGVVRREVLEKIRKDFPFHGWLMQEFEE